MFVVNDSGISSNSALSLPFHECVLIFRHNYTVARNIFINVIISQFVLSCIHVYIDEAFFIPVQSLVAKLDKKTGERSKHKPRLVFLSFLLHDESKSTITEYFFAILDVTKLFDDFCFFCST